MSDTITITAEKMVFGGDCIGKFNGKTVFVPYAIPGEKLEVEITRDERDYCVASIVNVLEKSPHRVMPFCSLYGKCGGCNMQHIDQEYQAELRAQILRDAFERESVTVGEIEVIRDTDQGSSFIMVASWEKEAMKSFQLKAAPVLQMKSITIFPKFPLSTDQKVVYTYSEAQESPQFQKAMTRL